MTVAEKAPDARAKSLKRRDPTIYPVEIKVGEDTLQRFIVELLRPLVERWLAQRGAPTFVGADQFIYYRQHHPLKSVAPDVYVLPGVRPGKRIRSWKLWKTGIAPSFALEVVSWNDPLKDYVEAPGRYDEVGVKELVLFDPDWEKSDDRVRWQRFRRLKARGFVLVERSNGDRVFSRVLGCWLRVVGEGESARVRIATGPEGETIFPSAEEAERAAKEAALAAEGAERMAKEAALARVAELEAKLAELEAAAKAKG